MSNYIKNIATLSGGTLISQIMLVITVPIIARLYSPQDLGISAFFIAIASILSAISTGKYDFAILLPKDQKNSVDIFFGSILINILFCSISLLMAWMIFLNFEDKIKYDLSWFFLTIILIFCNGLNLSLIAWFNRNKEYQVISIGRILKNLLLVSLTVILGLYYSESNDKSILIIISNIIGILLFNILLLIVFINRYAELWKLFSYKRSIRVLKEHLDFPKYSLPASMINIISGQSPIIILYLLFGPLISGVYSLVHRVMGAPTQLIAISTGEVYRQRASDLYNKNGNCEELFLKTFKGLFLISIVPFLIVTIFGPKLFLLIFGEGWSESGYFARYLALFFLLKFCVSPLSFTLIIGGRQDYNLMWQSFLFVNTTLGIICGYFMNDYRVSILLFSFIYSTMYLIYFKEIRSTAKGKN